MTNDFAKIITRYFGRYLIDDRGCSPQTIETYRYAFIQFINYMDSVKKIKPEKISMHDFNFGNVNDFQNILNIDCILVIFYCKHNIIVMKPCV